MTDSDNPPTYTEAQASPPQYTLPETFDIGHHRVGLLIQPQHLKGHLSLLHAFHTLRKTVEAGDARFSADVCVMEAEKRWGWFVNIAVERFDRWCQSLSEESINNIEFALPPVDVVMVWHAYLLNPIWYGEDTARISTLEFFPVLTNYLGNHIESPALLTTSSPHHDRIRIWEQMTNTTYDPLDAASILSHKDVQCPHCEKQTSVPFIKPDGSGYAQGNFKAICMRCSKTITKDLLGLRKFVTDVVKTIRLSPPEGFLAGTLYTPYERSDVVRATMTKKRVIAAAGLATRSQLSVDTAMKKLGFDYRPLTRKLIAQIQGRMARRILSAYVDDRPFSIELVGAVLRQASFVSKMADLGWTEPGFFADEEDMVVLQHCVARYHAFLGLMADSPGSFFVPTLDIDLAWHTHQLRANHYQVECKKYVGRYVDHDDKVDEDHLATSFDVTCRAWSDRYGLPYTYCGCPLPGTTLAQRLRRALHLQQQHDANSNDPLQPPPEAEAATHASDHNAVFPLHDRRASERARERRRQKSERRRLRQERDRVEKGAGPVTVSSDRLGDHGLAFFYPIPLWAGPGPGLGFGFGVGCVGVPGIVYGGACATGAGGSCGSGGAACSGAGCGGGGAAGGGGSTCGGGGGGGCGGGGGGCGGGGGGGGGCGGGG